MNSSNLDRFFSHRWHATIQQCEKSLERDDLEQVRLITSWDLVQREVLEWPDTSLDGRSIPYEIALIEPILGHVRQYIRDTAWHFGRLLLGHHRPAAEAHWTRFASPIEDSANAQVPWLQGRGLQGIPRRFSQVLPSMKESCFDIQI